MSSEYKKDVYAVENQSQGIIINNIRQYKIEWTK